MNTSKKHKSKNKPNKPVNPNQSEKSEITVESEKEKPVSENVEVSVEGVKVEAAHENLEKDMEPKKPKRNKNKKKKTPEEEAIEQDLDITPTVIPEAIKESDNNVGVQEKASVEPIIAPTIRKKNKNKQFEAVIQQPKDTVKTEILATLTKKEEQIDTQPVSSTGNIKDDKNEQDAKVPKKKNKKKKRHDSERSEKADEVISCTAAFQMLLDVKTDKKENIIDLPTIESETEQKHINIPPEAKETKAEDVTSKKKNKKAKNKEENQSKPMECEILVSTSQDELVHLKPEEKVSEKVVEEVLITDTEEKENAATPKPKAKIAKPVERKQKHKPEEQTEEKATTISVAVADKGLSKEIEFDKSVSLGEILFKETITIKGNEQQQVSKGSEKKEEENLTLPADIVEHVMKQQEVSKKIYPNQKKNAQEKIESTTKPIEIKKTEDLPLSDDDNFIIPSLLDITEDEPKIVKEKPIVCQEDSIKNIKTKDVEQPVQETDIYNISCQAEKPESADELQVPCNKRKKRKKSPKPPITTDSVIVIQDIPQPKPSEIKIETPSEEIQVKSESEPALIQFQQIKTTEEISKQKSAEGETKLKQLEVTPDLIQYPRSMSHQISDSNNNTFIQEIKTTDQGTLNIPIVIPETPLIKGSGETPDEPPELKMSDVTITEVKTMHTSETSKEKTDLKSKVMEVNQDMEDLRLSIERSLAELTFLENKENETEKLYQEKGITSEFEAEASKVITKLVDPKPFEPKVETETQVIDEVPILPPPRQDNKGKGKSKKKNKHETQQVTSQVTTTTQTQVPSTQTSQPTESKDNKDDKSEQKSETAPEKSKQSDAVETQKATSESSQTYDKNEIFYSTKNKEGKTKEDTNSKDKPVDSLARDFEPIENFEDAMTSSLDDVNKTFEMIANDSTTNEDSINNPQISITAPEEETVKRDVKENINPVSQPKNLLGHPDIPVPSNRTDYKKEKNRPPNTRQAKVKIKDAVEIEPKSKQSKESQTESKGKLFKKDTTVEESVTCVTNENEEYVYKYSFRKVFLPNICHICKKELKAIKVPCNYCSLIFYCSNKHKDEGWSQHQALCFAVSTVAHHKNQKHIYADSKGLTGQAYRVFRMQLIVACEKVLKRRLVPWEQEAVLYPRICADLNCREHRQEKLKDCECCGQISYCAEEHLPKGHQKWCKSYSLYQKLVYHQQTQGRLAPKLPTRVLTQETQLPDKINMVLATLYEEKIDMNDIQYAALTQIATAPLTAAYSYQLYNKALDTAKLDRTIFTIHIVNAELQYEADALNKWESLFLHLYPQVNDLRIVLTGTDLNPGGLPLDLLGKVKLCANCRLHARKLNFSFQDSRTYTEYWDTNDFLTPDIVCAFNPSIQRATIYNGKDQWPLTINTIFKLKSPFLITSYTMNELNRDLNRIKESSKIDFKVISKANFNPFASVRPDRNFITDDEIPLLFKNYCFAVLCGV